MSWPTSLKAAVERGLVSSGLPTISRRARRRDVLVLAYHNIVPTGVEVGGDSSLHLTEALFATHLDALQDTHEVVPLQVVVTGDEAAGDRPRAVITFDDAYRGAVTVGIRELVRRALPATVFVAPAFVGRFFWWDVMTPAGAAGPSESLRKRALDECRGMDNAVRQIGQRSGDHASMLPADAACASEEELLAVSKQPGITLASHSWSHPNLVRLGATELDEELTRPLDWLGARFDSVLPVLAYPYGLASPAVEAAAARAGYQAALLVSGGWTSSRPRNPFAVPRLNVPAGLSRDGFLLRTAGLVWQ